MKSNWNDTLERWTRCIPCQAREMVQAAVVENSDVVCTHDGWYDADSLSGLTARSKDGSLVIGGSIVTKISHATQDGYNTDLNRATPYSVAQIEWRGNDPSGLEIQKVIAYLHPKRTGDPQEVARWGCQLMALVEVEDEDILHLRPLGTTIWVEESGAIAHEVTFDFSALGTKPMVKAYRPNDPWRTYQDPTTFVFIYAIDDDGNPADNVGWGRDSTEPSATTSSNVMKGITLTELAAEEDRGKFTATDTSMTPYLTLQTGTFSQQTVEYTANDFDLGATPASADEVVFVVQGSEHSGTSLTASARVPGGSYVTVKDGQTAAEVGLAANRYYEMRCVFDPDSTGVVSPILRRLGVEDVAITNLSSVVDVKEIHRQVDPVTLKTYVTKAKLVGIQNGVRDYSDAVTTLFKTRYVGQIELRIYWGHPDLDREYWMELGTFIEPVYRDVGGGLEIVATSPLALLKAQLPKFDTGTNTRAPLTYAGETLKDVYEDLLDGQMELPGRWRGPGVEDDTTTVSRHINEKLDAKRMLDAIAYCDGSAVGESQGRIQVFDMYGDKSIVRAFPSKTINSVYVSPGYEHRLPEWTVSYDWSEDQGRYLQERRYHHAASLTKLGRSALNDIKDPGDDVMKWLDTLALTDTIGWRGVNLFGAGLLTLGFNSIYAYPELELGDLVAVETDRFVAVDPNTANAVAGRLWLLAVIADHDKRGENFVVWCRDYADIFSSAAAGTVTLGLKRFLMSVGHSTSQTIYNGADSDLAFNTEDEDVGGMHDNSTNNERGTVPIGGKGRYTVKAQIPYNDTLDPPRAQEFSFYINGSWANRKGIHYKGTDMTGEGDFVMAADLDLEDGDYVTVHVSGPDVTNSTGSFVIGEDVRFWMTRRGV